MMISLLRGAIMALLSLLVIILTIELNRFHFLPTGDSLTREKESPFNRTQFLSELSDLAKLDSRNNVASDAAVQHNLDLIRPRPSNLRIIFLGDSVTRYQYLSLAYFLRYGRWFDPSITVSHLVNSHSFQHPFHPTEDWNEFFWQTNRMLYPYEMCDCLRRITNVTIERRYFYDSERNNTLVYLNLNGNETDPNHGYYGRIHPNTIFQLFRPGIVGGLGNHSTNIVWDYETWSTVISKHVAALQLQPAYAVLNAGLHSHSFRNSQRQTSIKAALQQAGLYGIWKTTTFTKTEIVLKTTRIRETDRTMCHILDHCFNISWTRHLRSSLYFDENHFLEPAYRIMNEDLLEQLGLLPDGYEKVDRSLVLEQ